MCRLPQNRKYKDTVFSSLFYSDRDSKKNLAQLCGALYQEETKEQDIRLVRLEQTLYMGMHNDSAFTVGENRLVLMEQQSTINWNMPLRLLLYVAGEYERLIPTEKRFKRNLLRIPAPEFITFYNGTDDFPQEQILKLSDAFFLDDGQPQPQLELTARVININYEKGHPLLQKCSVLREYSHFVKVVRKAITSGGSMEQAVQCCIERGILTDFLRRHSTEVINMLFAEYDYDTDIRVQRQEAREEGIVEGRQEGRQEGREEGREEGKIFGAVETMIEDGRDVESISCRISGKFKLSPEEARRYIAIVTERLPFRGDQAVKGSREKQGDTK